MSENANNKSNVSEVQFTKEEQEFLDGFSKSFDTDWEVRIKMCRRIIELGEQVLKNSQQVNDYSSEDYCAKEGVFQIDSNLPGDIFKAKCHQQTENGVAKVILEEANAAATGHFVYKSGKHGSAYIDKLQFCKLDTKKFDKLLKIMVGNAVILGGLTFRPGITVTVIGPSYGASGYSHPVALELSRYFPETTFNSGSTQVDSDGKQFLPEKLINVYKDSDEFVFVEDIVNSGTTLREIRKLFRNLIGKSAEKALAIVSRGGQTESSLGLEEGFFPLFDIKMDQFDPRIPEELVKINELPEINTVLGKGKLWIGVFGPGPYPLNTDFSDYPFE